MAVAGFAVRIRSGPAFREPVGMVWVAPDSTDMLDFLDVLGFV
jgi:hypothetical protein